jgi:TB2/DP1, HVA22 family
MSMEAIYIAIGTSCHLVWGILARILCMVFGTVYPVYGTYKSITAKQDDTQSKWLSYWIVVLPLMILECFPFIVNNIVCYTELKMMFLGWLVLPKWNGAEIVYTHLIAPYLSKHEKKIDEALLSVRNQASQKVSQLKDKGLQHARKHSVQLLMKGTEMLHSIRFNKDGTPVKTTVPALPSLEAVREAQARADHSRRSHQDQRQHQYVPPVFSDDDDDHEESDVSQYSDTATAAVVQHDNESPLRIRRSTRLRH